MMDKFILAIFLACLFIQWNTGRISHKLDDVLEEMRKMKDGDTNDR